MTLIHRVALTALFSLVLAGNTRAQLAAPVADLNPGLDAGLGSRPSWFLPFDGRVLMATRDPGDFHPSALWITDGTANGTRQLGSRQGLSDPLGRVFDGFLWIDRTGPRAVLRRTNGSERGTYALTDPAEEILESAALLDDRRAAFFTLGVDPAGDPDWSVHPLWITDGSRRGTGRVAELDGWILDSQIFGSAGRLFFLAAPDTSHDGTRDADEPWWLWTSDGTESGTRAVARIGSESWRQVEAAPGGIFFTTVEERARSRETSLWTSTGTAASTRVVARFELDADDGFVISTVGATAFFRMPFGRELWSVDGRRTGARRLTRASRDGVPLDTPVAAGNTASFLTYHETLGLRLYRTDGTPRGTAPVTTIAPPLPPGFALQFGALVSAGRAVYFRAMTLETGPELWVSDGTAAGTGLVGEICPGECGGALADPVALPDGRVALLGSNFEQGTELWIAAGRGLLERVTDFDNRVVFPLSAPLAIAATEHGLVFAADDGLHGFEPWLLPPSQTRASLLVDLASPGGASSNPIAMTSFRGGLLFLTSDRNGVRLHFRAGDNAAPVALANLGIVDCGELSETYPRQDTATRTPLISIAGELAYINIGSLWRTDGTPEGTFRLLENIDQQNGVYDPTQFSSVVPLGNGGAFWRREGEDTPVRPRHQLWRTDGTVTGTVRLDVFPQPFEASDLTFVDGLLYFIANDFSSADPSDPSIEAWRSDGTAAGTHALTDRSDAGSDRPRRPLFVEASGRIAFLLAHRTRYGLWSTDGTREGTERWSEQSGFPGGFGARPIALAALGDRFVLLEAGNEGNVLWTSDGTPQGTERVRALATADPFAQLSAGAERLFVRTTSNIRETGTVWVSDGTTAGTLPVSIPPEVTITAPFAAAGDRFFFAAADADHGSELWTLDAGSTTARRLEDLAPGAGGSLPLELAVAGERLYFGADDGLLGRELWSLPLADGEPGCEPSMTALCLLDRFRVELTWRGETNERFRAAASPLGEGTGLFTFARPDGPEVVIKMLDGKAVTGAHWVFGGGLTNRGYEITVLDTRTGATRRYLNRGRQLVSFGDTGAFPGGSRSTTVLLGETRGFELAPRDAAHEPPARIARRGSCVPSATRLCLLGGRFALNAVRADSAPVSASSFSDRAGWFWLAREDNPELVVKLVDARAIGAGVWLFVSSLGARGLQLTVDDLEAGITQPYYFGVVSSLIDATTFGAPGSTP